MVEMTLRGIPAFTPAALTLPAADGGTRVFAGSDGAAPAASRHDVGGDPSARDSSGAGPAPFVNALFIAGTPSRSVGVFRGRAGALNVATATAERIAGPFELEAVSLAAGDPNRAESASVRVPGSFLVLDPCAAATSQAAAPCARRSRRVTGERLRFLPPIRRLVPQPPAKRE